MAAKRASETAKSKRVFGQRQEAGENVPRRASMRACPRTTSRLCRCRCAPCGSTPPGAAGRSRFRSKKSVPAQQSVNCARNLLAAARRREIDVVLVWRLDRWGRSLVDLVVTLKELAALGVGFVSLTEALDLTTPTGRAMAGLLSVFAEFEQRDSARTDPRRHCRSAAERQSAWAGR